MTLATFATFYQSSEQIGIIRVMMGFPTETLTLLKGNGTRHAFEGLVDIKSIHTNDIKIPYEMNDEVERKLPNGMAEIFVIENPAFFQGHGGIDDFYELKVARRGSRRPIPIDFL